MHENRVVKRYATALFNLAVRQQVVEELASQLQDIAAVFRGSKLIAFLKQPQVSIKEKEAVLMNAFGHRSHHLVQSLLRLMLRKQRISQFGSVAEYFYWLTDRHRGVEEITVITAVELPEEYYSEMLERASKFSESPRQRLVRQIDPGILGGYIIQLGRDKVIDQSLRTALGLLRRRMVKHRLF